MNQFTPTPLIIMLRSLFALLLFLTFCLPAKAAEDVKALVVAAEKGDLNAQLKLGDLYSVGEGVPKDYASAVRYYRMAAEQGDAAAENNLGALYSNYEPEFKTGRYWGIKRDLIEGLRWTKLAAAQGNKEAIQGLKTPNMILAEGAENGKSWNQYQLGINYYVADRNYEESYFWISLALKGTPPKNTAAYQHIDPIQILKLAANLLTPEEKDRLDKRVQEWKPTPSPPAASPAGK